MMEVEATSSQENGLNILSATKSGNTVEVANSSAFWLAYTLGITSQNSTMMNVTTTTWMTNPSVSLPEKLKSCSVISAERTTMAMLMKLIAMSKVANSLLGLLSKV